MTPITLADYLMGRAREYPLSDAKLANAQLMVAATNALLSRFWEDRKVVSGYRPAAINAKTPGAAPFSKHLTCRAVDLEDKDKALARWCQSRPELLAACGLWMEHPDDTPTWCHLQIVPPGSGKRCFRR